MEVEWSQPGEGRNGHARPRSPDFRRGVPAGAGTIVVARPGVFVVARPVVAVAVVRPGSVGRAGNGRDRDLAVECRGAKVAGSLVRGGRGRPAAGSLSTDRA